LNSSLIALIFALQLEKKQVVTKNLANFRGLSFLFIFMGTADELSSQLNSYFNFASTYK
jgi:hypothetical protein